MCTVILKVVELCNQDSIMYNHDYYIFFCCPQLVVVWYDGVFGLGSWSQLVLGSFILLFCLVDSCSVVEVWDGRKWVFWVCWDAWYVDGVCVDVPPEKGYELVVAHTAS